MEVNGPAIFKLKRIVENQYNCIFEYDSFSQDPVDLNLVSIKERLQQGNPITVDNWTFFPVFQNGQLSGAGRVSAKETLSDRQLTQLQQIIQMILEAAITNDLRLEQIHNFERPLIPSQNHHNVLHLKDYRPNVFPFPSVKDKETSALNFSFLVECKDKQDAFKLAVEINNFAHRYAMIPYDDLSKDALANPETLKAMGKITIFVDEICTLTQAQQQQLADYFAAKRDNDTPHFVAATHIPLAEIKMNNLLLPELLNHLLTGYIRLNQSFQLYKKADLIQFFFNTLTGRQS